MVDGKGLWKRKDFHFLKKGNSYCRFMGIRGWGQHNCESEVCETIIGNVFKGSNEK